MLQMTVKLEYIHVSTNLVSRTKHLKKLLKKIKQNDTMRL